MRALTLLALGLLLGLPAHAREGGWFNAQRSLERAGVGTYAAPRTPPAPRLQEPDRPMPRQPTYECRRDPSRPLTRAIICEGRRP